MPLPEFTDEEKYLINHVKSPNVASGTNPYMWGYLIGGAILAAFAIYYAIPPMMFVAFLVVCGFRIYEDRYTKKWMPLWGSIIEKYELACNEPKHPDDGDDPNSDGSDGLNKNPPC